MKVNKHLLNRALYTLVTLVVAIGLLPGMSSALSAEQKKVFDSGIYYFDVASSACGSTSDVPLSVNLPKVLIDAINKNKAVYQEVGAAKDIPWQILAALHYREHNFEVSNPSNGYGIYQIVSKNYPPGAVDEATFLSETQDAADFFLGKLGSNLPNHRDRITQAKADADTIKDTFFSYNGRSSLYADQAAKYGFDPATQPYEGSPYVMNKFDAARQSMGIITHDHGGIDGQDQRYGAYTLYAALAGVSGGGDNCSGVTGNSVVEVALAELNKNVAETPDGSNSGPVVDLYTDGHPEFWCADFVSWVYNKAGSPFTGGLSGGWRISSVSTLRGWLESQGQYTVRQSNSFPPQPGDVVILAGDASSTDSRGPEGHSGIVYQVNGNVLITIEGNSSNQVAKRTYPNYTANPGVTGWGRQ